MEAGEWFVLGAGIMFGTLGGIALGWLIFVEYSLLMCVALFFSLAGVGLACVLRGTSLALTEASRTTEG